MSPLTLEIEFVVDHGPVVTLVGIDKTTGKQAAVHMDLRPRDSLWKPIRTSSDPLPTTFAAQGLIAAVDFCLVDLALEVADERR